MLDQNGKQIFDNCQDRPFHHVYLRGVGDMVPCLYQSIGNISVANVRDDLNILILTGNLDAEL